ncbi:response regulator transcription factor [Schaalia sp. 19OD2882]|uniref:response regulator transcription factor n=1 Tax=Schaalia sp. 19OD2882 TaxID=2794089 RepID=UPI001C1EC422|nr:response regulator transcription factor [Schaalia sp. 19OD2882]QWW19745.1 response regulator transcription factor [Schaalia sp. 19OD2882]
MSPHALAVDDEPQMLSIISFALETQGFTCATAPNTARAWDYMRAHRVDLVILDVMTPTGSGIDLTRRIRGAGSHVPIILLTALGDEEDRIAGLEAGADDYVTKPFSPREVALRAQAVVRRTLPAEEHRSLSLGDLRIDSEMQRATWRGAAISLSPTELRVLTVLAAHAGADVAWRDLLNEAWATSDAAGAHDMIKSTVYRLRRQLERAGMDPGVVQSVRGRGYRLSIPS